MNYKSVWLSKAFYILLLPTLFLTVIGCGSTETGTASSSRSQSAATGDQTPRLHVGMTKSQVIRAWGEPSGKQVTDQGELWIWGNQGWKRMIPYAGSFLNVQTSKAYFGANGTLKSFRCTDQGNVMSASAGYSGGFNAQ
ncbi:MAG: hypothetical protein ABI443_05595 [Chthoniobacterales bacterium]